MSVSYDESLDYRGWHIITITEDNGISYQSYLYHNGTCLDSVSSYISKDRAIDKAKCYIDNYISGV